MTSQKKSQLRFLRSDAIDAAEPFRLPAESIPQLVWTARPDGPLDYANRRWVEYTGLSAEQSQGWSRERRGSSRRPRRMPRPVDHRPGKCHRLRSGSLLARQAWRISLVPGTGRAGMRSGAATGLLV
ncbi:MAG: PAS domain-containing protein [Pirellulaceae bacterium]